MNGNPRTKRAEQSSHDGNPRTKGAEQSSHDGKKPDWKEVLGLILGTVIFATLALPILHLSGVHDWLVRLSVESSKILLQLFGHPST